MGFRLSSAPPQVILASAGMLRIPQAIPNTEESQHSRGESGRRCFPAPTCMVVLSQLWRKPTR